MQVCIAIGWIDVGCAGVAGVPWSPYTRGLCKRCVFTFTADTWEPSSRRRCTRTRAPHRLSTAARTLPFRRWRFSLRSLGRARRKLLSGRADAQPVAAACTREAALRPSAARRRWRTPCARAAHPRGGGATPDELRPRRARRAVSRRRTHCGSSGPAARSPAAVPLCVLARQLEINRMSLPHTTTLFTQSCRGSLSLPSHVAHAPKAVGALRLREPGFLTRSSHASSSRHW